jgi:RNA polymerase sigma-70 factor (ECF subfamily)
VSQLSGPSRVIVDEDADRAAIERYRHGDREAFAELVIRYQRPIYNAAFWILRRAEDASDVTQDVFVRIAERLGEYDARYKFFSWIYRIAVNESLNRLRRNEREEPLDNEIELPDTERAGPERSVSEAQQAARLRTALMQLSTADRTVVTLRHFSELSYQEIGLVLDIDEKTVKSRLFEARQRLRQMLGDLRPD